MAAPSRKAPVKARVPRRRSAGKARANRDSPGAIGRLVLRALETASEKSAEFLSATGRKLSRVQDALRHKKQMAAASPQTRGERGVGPTGLRQPTVFGKVGASQAVAEELAVRSRAVRGRPGSR
jgi:hypothetical protein